MKHDEAQTMAEMPATVRALYEPVPGHLLAALDEAERRNPAAAQLFAWAVRLGRWASSEGRTLEALDRHPAWPRITGDLAAVARQLAHDPDVARFLEPAHVATVVCWRFLHRVLGPEAAEAWRGTALPLRVKRLWPEQRVRLTSQDGEPALVALGGTQTEVKRLWPVLEWHRRLAGLPPERRGRPGEAVPPDVFLGQLARALQSLRTADPRYQAGQKIPLTEIADQAGYSRQRLHELLNEHHVDRTRVRWWRLGQPIPLTEGHAPRGGAE